MLAPEIAQGSLRISLDISNTEEEIDYMLEVIPQVVEQLRGAVLAGASEKEVSMIEQIANKVGIAFQIEDDILDVVSTSEEIGKPAGSDEKNGKNTYVLFKGIEQSKKDAEQYTREALQIFDELEYKNPFLRELLLYLVGRKN